MAKINRTSSIRTGFDYQDIWSLKLCGEWLSVPDKYKTIHFEVSADEEDESVLYLDDIAQTDSQEKQSLYQVKYRVNAEDAWAWKDLIKAKKATGTSNLKKWAQSVLPRLEKLENASLITNAKAADEIAQFLTGNKISITALKKTDPTLYTAIQAEIGSKKDVITFFEKFTFLFSQKSRETLETEVREHFYKNLYVTESGVNSLLIGIHNACAQRTTSPLTLEQIKSLCEYDTPRPLNEDFGVPSDFQFFDNTTHGTILSDLQNRNGGVKVIFGKPGVGKSVYLSKLAGELKEKDILCIKHHYHLSPEDSNPRDRLNKDRVVEGIKAQLKAHREELGDLANKNSGNIRLKEFITEIAKNLAEKQKPLVLIIDGLDHVMRHGDEKELKALLGEICYPQEGVWIVVGMQPQAEKHLPQIVFDRSPKQTWIEISGLTQQATFTLIKENKISLHLSEDHEALKRLADKLYEITAGNSLHLRYSLQQLKNRLGGRAVSEYECRDLIPYGESIEKYYEAMWNQIPDKAKTILLLIESVNFNFTEEQLLSCSASMISDPSEISAAFSSISHLVSKNLRNQISVYHNSFEVFLGNRPEASQQKITLKSGIKKWLVGSNYKYLKWAELRLIEYELGNRQPILEIDRDWLIDAISLPANPEQIFKQLKTAAKAAFEEDNFSKALNIAHLHNYYLNSADFVETPAKLILKEAMLQNPDCIENLDFLDLAISGLEVAAQIADTKGDISSVEEIIDVLIDGLGSQEYRANSVPRASEALVSVLPYDRTHDVEKIHKYITQFRNMEVSSDLFRSYSHQLLLLDQKEKVKALIALELKDDEREAILNQCAIRGIEFNNKDFLDLFDTSKTQSLFSLLYCAINSKNIDRLPDLPDLETLPARNREHDSEEQSKWGDFFYQMFWICVLYALSGKQGDVENLATQAPISWAGRAAKDLITTSLRVAKEIQSGNIGYQALFADFGNLEKLKWPEDQDTLGFQHSMRRALERIFDDLISINKYKKILVSKEDFEIITKYPYLFNAHLLTSVAIDREEPVLAPNLYEEIRARKLKELGEEIQYLDNRAEEYANLARLDRIYSHPKEDQEKFLKLSASCMLGHRNHKDIYQYDVLDAIESIAETNAHPDKVLGWIYRLAKLIQSVGEYTDGDETHHLDVRIAEVLVPHMPKIVWKYYFEAVENEEDLYHAQELFSLVIKSLKYENTIEEALGSTALDKISFLELQKIAGSNPGAFRSIEKIETYFGKLNHKEKDGESGSGSHKPPEKTIPNYSEISPSELLTYLSEKFENTWEMNDFLFGWIGHWLATGDAETVYKAAKEAVEKIGIKNANGSILDQLYPLAFRFDNGLAFEYLCQAQMNDHGWDRYWTDSIKAENRWKFLKEKFPTRYMEFFHKSTNYHMPLARSAEFFIFFDDIDHALEITDAAVDFAESLMADLPLPEARWINHTEVDQLDLLIQRLIWPSALVQERAATGLAHLILEQVEKKEAYSRLLHWISGQKLETNIAVGFLPFMQAMQINTAPVTHINLAEIIGSIPFGSEVICALIKEFARLSKAELPNLPVFHPINSYPAGYEVSSFFSKHVNTFLAPIYTMRASKLDRGGRSFLKQWSFTADELVGEIKKTLNMNQVYYYARRADDEFLLGFSSQVSEIYRSAFLRVLQAFHDLGESDEDLYLKYAYATLPIELSKWKLLPGELPDWWPKLKPGETATEESIAALALENPIESLIQNNGGSYLIAAEGAMQPSEGFNNQDPSHSFLLMGFGYDVIGTDLPSAEEVIEEIAHNPAVIRRPTATDKPFNFLEDQEKYLPANNPIQIRDLIIYPIVGRERDLTIALWQYFRDYYAPLTISLDLVDDFELHLNKDNWTYKKTGSVLSTYSDWLGGLRERYHRDLPLPHGQHIKVDRVLLEKWLKDNGLRLGYFLETTYTARRYSYDPLQKVTEAKLINVSSIMI